MIFLQKIFQINYFFLLFISSLFLSFPTKPSFAEGGLFHYVTDPVPLYYGDCASLKNEIAKKFAEAANVDILTTSCSQSSSNLIVDITYTTEAETPISLVSTRDLKSPKSFNGRGYMTSLRECESQKTKLLEMFSLATGLSPFFSYCTQDESIDQTDHPWHLAVDAVGNSIARYQFLSILLHEDRILNLPSIHAGMLDYFKQRPNTTFVGSAHWRDSIDFSRVGFGIFSKDPLIITFKNLLSFSTINHCETEAKVLGLSLEQTQTKLMYAGCKVQTANKPVLLFTLFDGFKKSPIQIGSLDFEFKNISECQAQRSTIFEDLRKRLGPSVVAILCNDSNQIPKAQLVTK